MVIPATDPRRLDDENPADEAYRELMHAWFLYQCGKRRQADRRRGLRLVVSRRTRQ
jgi:hypothetical protein